MALVVFTGGARSGKSSAAVRLVASREADQGVTVVVFGRESVDEEFARRIAQHRADRPPSWNTLEVSDPAGWVNHVPELDLVLVDCLGTLLGLIIEDVAAIGGDSDQGTETHAGQPVVGLDDVNARLDAVIDWLAAREGDTVVVTNEVGDGVVPAYESGRLFRDVLGRANRRLVDAADAAYLCVAGRLVDLVALPSAAMWPED